MPKIHDLCQLFAEEALSFLVAIPEGKKTLSLAWIYHEVEADLLGRRPDSAILAQHLWLTLEEVLRHRTLEANPPPLGEEGFDSNFREDDPRLAYAADDAIKLARKLFP